NARPQLPEHVIAQGGRHGDRLASLSGHFLDCHPRLSIHPGRNPAGQAGYHRPLSLLRIAAAPLAGLYTMLRRLAIGDVPRSVPAVTGGASARKAPPPLAGRLADPRVELVARIERTVELGERRLGGVEVAHVVLCRVLCASTVCHFEHAA